MKITKIDNKTNYSCSRCNKNYGDVWPYFSNNVSGKFEICPFCGHDFVEHTGKCYHNMIHYFRQLNGDYNRFSNNKIKVNEMWSEFLFNLSATDAKLSWKSMKQRLPDDSLLPKIEKIFMPESF